MAGEDVAMHVEDHGVGPTVVLLHGWCGTGEHFAPQARDLAVDHRVLVPDLPWHGRSEAAGPISVAAFANALNERLAELADGPALLVGHSLGGLVAVEAAADRPEGVSGVVVLDSGFAISAAARDYVRANLRALEAGDPRTVIRKVAAGLFAPYDAVAVRERLIDEFAASDPVLLVEGQRALIEQMDGPGDRALGMVPRPVAIVSASAPFSDLSEVVRLRPDAVFAQVLGSGHYVQIFAAAQVAAMIRQFERLVDAAQAAPLS
jgi:pimeloyl-ACP methyl ester carboxylesterase